LVGVAPLVARPHAAEIGAVQPLHEPGDVERLMADQPRCDALERRGHRRGVGGAHALAVARDAGIGVHLHQDRLRTVHHPVGPVVGLAVGQEERCGADGGDAHRKSPGAASPDEPGCIAAAISA